MKPIELISSVSPTEADHQEKEYQIDKQLEKRALIRFYSVVFAQGVYDKVYRGRDIHCWMPPAQIPAGVIHAPGSHLGWLTTNPTSSFSYTFEPLGHAFPARCPARVLLSRVPLGPLSLAPPAPPPVAQVCSPASTLL